MNATLCNRHVIGHAGSRPSVLFPLGLAILFVTTKWALLAGIFLLIAIVMGLVGFGALPKQPLERTRKRLTTDVNLLKERVA